MKTIRFTAYPDGYKCSEPGDQSGEYVKAADFNYRQMRDLFAAAALPTCLQAMNEAPDGTSFIQMNTTAAKIAYEIADLMMVERARGECAAAASTKGGAI